MGAFFSAPPLDDFLKDRVVWITGACTSESHLIYKSLMAGVCLVANGWRHCLGG